MTHVGIVNLGISNINSAKMAFESNNAQVSVLTEVPSSKESSLYDGIVLPGVGNFSYAMENLNKKKFTFWLKEKILEDKIPLLGICLGMQLLAEEGEEGKVNSGLAFIPGRVIKLSSNLTRIPHQGWDDIRIVKKTPLFISMPESPSFYFVHSFYFNTDPKFVSSFCNYGKDFASSVQKDHIFGVQFHPEKSQKYGNLLIKNFIQFLRR